MNLDEQSFLRRIGLELRQRRESLNFTQGELADKCGLHRTFIGSVERGERNVSILNLRLISGQLRVSLADLLGAIDRSRPRR
jgi:transcriptional regulator with XRE-family HTH domain